jgi:homoaconitase/3-isopropylmalate dehydratase large subunit
VDGEDNEDALVDDDREEQHHQLGEVMATASDDTTSTTASGQETAEEKKREQYESFATRTSATSDHSMEIDISNIPNVTAPDSTESPVEQQGD